MILRFFFHLVSILLLNQHADAKYVNDKVKLRMNFDDLSNYSTGRRVMMDGLHYITHFACQIGKCTWEVRVRAINPARALNRANANRDYILDESKFSPVRNHGIWRYFDENDPEAMRMNTGDAPINMRVILDAEWNDKKLSKRSFTPKLAGRECMGDIKSRLTRELNVPLNGQWSKWYSGALLQKSRPHHWYFVLEDCEGNFINTFTDKFGVKPHSYLPHVQFEYELRLLNVDGSHFGYEYWGMPTFTFIVGVLATVGFIYFLYQQLVVQKNQGSHRVVQAVNLALLTLIIWLWFHYAHLLKFKVDGYGLPFLDGLGTVIRSLGNIALMVAVFGVALGWSLNVPEMTMPGEAFLALATCYGFVELILTLAQYKTSSLRYHIHASEGAIPVIICIFRMILSASFVLACEFTKARDDYSNDSVRIFVEKFKWRGMLMMASNVIIMVFVSLFFAYYQQNRYMEMLCCLADLASIIYLGVAFVTPKTSYFKASVMGNSLLPFGGGRLSSMNNFQSHHRLD